MNKLLKQILLVCVGMVALPAASFAACYTVYDKSDKPVYKSSEPPFDLSIPISEGIKSKYPGGYLIQNGERASCYLRSKESNEALKKSKEVFENRQIQLRSQGFSEVKDRIMILSFPKKVVVSRPQNIPILPVTQDEMSIGSTIDDSALTSTNGAYMSLTNQQDTNCRYKSSTGTCYKYDLSNPGDQIRYSIDLNAQLLDSINVNPSVDIDRGIGQFGGGIKR